MMADERNAIEKMMDTVASAASDRRSQGGQRIERSFEKSTRHALLDQTRSLFSATPWSKAMSPRERFVCERKLR